MTARGVVYDATAPAEEHVLGPGPAPAAAAISHLVEIVVPGQPVPWARARRNGRRYFTSPEVAEHRRAIQRAWMAAGRPRAGGGVPLSMALLFFLERPTSHYRTGRNSHLLRDDAPAAPIGKPDCDNLAKAPMDALNGLLYADDAQVICLASVAKYYCDPDELPRTLIQAWRPHPRLRL